MAKRQHLTGAERAQIEVLLQLQTPLKQIAEKLDKHPATISREIRARSIVSDGKARYRIRNRCIHRADCKKYYVCGDGATKSQCSRRCSACNLCNEICEDFVEQICGKLFEPPYVCNGCHEEYQCPLSKKFYLNKDAQDAYREKLVNSRTGANITEAELLALDKIVTPLIQQGQSVHHIVTNNPDQFEVSEKTIYRYVDGCLLTARNIDMPRVCRLKPRRSKPVEHKVDRNCRVGRTYADFREFTEKSDVAVVQIDSVLGRVGGRVLLTMMFNCDLMLGFIRERNTSQSVIDKFDWMYSLLGPGKFKELFPVLLADNGSEFSNPSALEFDAQENRRTRVFYCDPYASFQKPNVELNHEFLRRILPKGTSFDNLTQSDINLIMSHINSYSREKLNNRSPIDLFECLYGTDTLDILGLVRIQPNDIILNKSLLKK